MKVIDKIAGSSTDHDGRVAFSFEFFTPKLPSSGTDASRAAAANAFIAKVARMAAHGAEFCDITWRPRDAELTLALAARMQAEVPVDTLLHLTCLGMSRSSVEDALASARAAGVHNILALRGDPPTPGSSEYAVDPDAPASALELVEFIKSIHHDYFGIAVAGYPEAHPSVIPDDANTATEEAYESDLLYLKKKFEAGGELIVTQVFFDVDIFLKFVVDCRRIGITCPIVPGIMPIATYRNFAFMTKTCRTNVPAAVRAAVEEKKGDEAALAAYGVELATEMCRKILEQGIRTLHFYTMNREEPSLAVLRNLGLIAGENMIPRTLEAKKEEREMGESIAVIG